MVDQSNQIYLKTIIGKNPDLSPAANTLLKLLWFLLSIAVLTSGIFGLGSEMHLFALFQIVFGSLVFLALLLQEALIVFFGYCYISFDAQNLVIKPKYFSPVRRYEWDHIAKVKFSYPHFLLMFKSADVEIFKFKVIFSNEDQLRSKFRQFAGLKHFEIED